MITKKEFDFKPSEVASKIEVPIWKVIHRFIATCIHLHKDGGRWVNYEDLVIMCFMYERITFDPLIVITRALDECNLLSFRGTYLDGGYFFTNIVRFVGFSIDQTHEMPIKVLGSEENISCG